MSIYDIDEAIQRLVDPETGELLDYEAFQSLQMERDAKIENIACWCVNLKAEAAAIKEQEKALSERRSILENRLARLKEYLGTALNGQKFTSPRVSVTYHPSKSVKLEGDKFWPWALENPGFFRVKEPEPDKKAISEALKAGITIPGASLEEKRSVIIK